MANNLNVLDGAGTSRTLKTTETASVHTPHHNVDALPADPLGANADAVVAAGAAGSLSAKARRLTTDLDAAKTAVEAVQATAGATSDAAVITDTTGTLSGKLRGLVKWAFERMPASLGQKAKGAALPVTLASDEDLLALAGVVTETAPATDTASSGLNGRLQRIAQRLSSLIALLPTALGAGGGLKVDGSGTALPVSGTVTVQDGGGALTVDSAQLPAALAAGGGMKTEQVEKTVLSASGTFAVSGDNTLIAAPAAGQRIVIVAFAIQNESSTATTMILKDGSTAFARCLGQNQGNGLARVYDANARKKLTAATALVLNLSGANSCGYSVDYYTEAV